MVSFLTIFTIFAGTFVASNKKLSDKNRSGFFFVLVAIVVVGGVFGWLLG